MQPPKPRMNLMQEIVHCTLQIKTHNVGVPGSGNGTGFLREIIVSEDRREIVIVTNKHVVGGTDYVSTKFTHQNSDGTPAIGQTYEARFRTESWIDHPDPEIDLTCLPITELLWEAEQSQRPLFVRAPRVADAAYLSQMTIMEDILMIGYPIGLQDERNNLPIARRGVTATAPAHDYEGRPEFLIDCACFPGSSGSPVFHANNLPNNVGSGAIMMAPTQFLFLGTLWGGPMHQADGSIEAVPVPTAENQTTTTNIPINLGLIIKATALETLDEIVRAAL